MRINKSVWAFPEKEIFPALIYELSQIVSFPDINALSGGFG